MKNYIIGYARVSTDNQNLDRQLDALKKYGVDKLYKEVNLVSLKESVDTSTSTGKLRFTLMSVIAQFERDVIAEHIRERLGEK